ncbi:hypothetical protein Tco_0779678 [Tanacetum coccineum]
MLLAFTSFFFWAFSSVVTGPGIIEVEHNLALESIALFLTSTSHSHPALEGETLQQHCFRQFLDPSLYVNKDFFKFDSS